MTAGKLVVEKILRKQNVAGFSLQTLSDEKKRCQMKKMLPDGKTSKPKPKPKNIAYVHPKT